MPAKKAAAKKAAAKKAAAKKVVAPPPPPAITLDEVRGRTHVMLIIERHFIAQSGTTPFPPSLGASSRILLRNAINTRYFADVGCTVTGPALAAARTFSDLVDAIFAAI